MVLRSDLNDSQEGLLRYHRRLDSLLEPAAAMSFPAGVKTTFAVSLSPAAQQDSIRLQPTATNLLESAGLLTGKRPLWLV